MEYFLLVWLVCKTISKRVRDVSTIQSTTTAIAIMFFQHIGWINKVASTSIAFGTSTIDKQTSATVACWVLAMEKFT